MAFTSAVDAYDIIYHNLELSMSSTDSEKHLKSKESIKFQVKRLVFNEVHKIIDNLLKDLYGTDYDSLERDMAKVAILDGKNPDDRIAVLRLIWNSVSDHYGNNPEELLAKIKGFI